MRYIFALALTLAACGAPNAIPPSPCSPACFPGQACIAGRCFVEVDADAGPGDAAVGDTGTADAPADVAGGDAPVSDVAVGDGATNASAVDASLCPAGWGECMPGVCVNLAMTAANCGACGYACPTQARCVSGSCVSPSGLTCPVGNADCDNNETTGCEAQLRVDHTNCGTCGNNCRAMSLFCRNGVCAP